MSGISICILWCCRRVVVEEDEPDQPIPAKRRAAGGPFSR